MVSIEQQFKTIKEKNPNLGDYIVLCMAVKGLGYSQSAIKSSFKKLVSDEHYSSSEKAELLDYLFLQTLYQP